MKLLKSIFVLSLITLSNITQAFFIVLDDGKEVTNTSTCLKLSATNKPMTRPCQYARQFTLKNNKLCEKKNQSNCLANWTRDLATTYWSNQNDKHLTIKEFNEEGGYFHVDYNGQVKKYKYAPIFYNFIRDYVEPITFPTQAGHWINPDGKCWTGDYIEVPIYLNTCRTHKRNSTRGTKVQHWKTEFDASTNATYIKSADGVMCLRVVVMKVYTIKCDENVHSAFTILHDGQIVLTRRPFMCLIPRLDGRRQVIKLGPCIQSLKLVNSIA